jgi:hypothetical protein
MGEDKFDKYGHYKKFGHLDIIVKWIISKWIRPT